MMRRSVRIFVVLLTVAVTAGVVWRATVNEQARGRMRLSSQQTDAAAADAIFELADLRSSLHAYVAPGQGIDFWSKRSQAQLQSVSRRLRDLEPTAAAASHPLSTALSSLDGLFAAEQRARAAVIGDQPLIAGDIVFTEARDLIDTAARDLSEARQAMARAESAREAGTANEQSLLAGGLIAVWIFALTVLVPAPTSVPPAHEDLLRGRPIAPVTPVAPDAPVPPGVTPVALVAPAAPVAPGVTPVASAFATADHEERRRDQRLLADVAELCTDIGRVADAGELSPLLERAAALIGARGLVVWLRSPDGHHLLPAMAHGYDDKLLGRMGWIGIDDHNLTAAAFRTSLPAHTAADAASPGAVAVPMLSASGPSGVLAAELPGGPDLAEAVAVASLLAAQLASLFPSGETVPKQEVGSET
jgi:hypothetical protein